MATDERIIQHESDVVLRTPVLIAAFKGWNDAGDAASFAAVHLGQQWGAKRFAAIDPEDFYDFQAVRPRVSLVDGITRKISWPSNEFWSAGIPEAPHDVILLVGTEPNTKWRTFSQLIVEVARQHGVQLVITLGALLADVPHSRPVHITGTAVNQSLVERLGLQRSRYEGPTGIVGVLQDAFSTAGIDSASLWAAVPHYLAVTPNPKAALALVEKASALIGVSVDVSDLQAATSTYEEKISEIVASDEDVQAYVALLEQRADEGAPHPFDPDQMPTGDALAAELEAYLRRRDEDTGSQQ